MKQILNGDRQLCDKIIYVEPSDYLPEDALKKCGLWEDKVDEATTSPEEIYI